MKMSYKRLWKLLIDRDMKKTHCGKLPELVHPLWSND